MKKYETIEDLWKVNIDFDTKWVDIDGYTITPYIMQVLNHLRDNSETGLGRRFGELLDKLQSVVAGDENFSNRT